LFPEALLVLLVGHSDTHGNVSKSKYGKNTNADGDTIVRRVEGGRPTVEKSEENTKIM
jgi:hypothetical protein